MENFPLSYSIGFWVRKSKGKHIVCVPPCSMFGWRGASGLVGYLLNELVDCSAEHFLPFVVDCDVCVLKSVVNHACLGHLRVRYRLECHGAVVLHQHVNVAEVLLLSDFASSRTV